LNYASKISYLITYLLTKFTTSCLNSADCNSAARGDSGSHPTDDQQSSLEDDALNGAGLLSNASDSLQVGATSRKRPASPNVADKPLFPDSKRRRRVLVAARRRTVFDAVAEHRQWCTWVTSAGGQEGQPCKPWLRLLRTLLSDAARKPMSVVACSSPKVLESIRHLFRSWASDSA